MPLFSLGQVDTDTFTLENGKTLYQTRTSDSTYAQQWHYNNGRVEYLYDHRPNFCLHYHYDEVGNLTSFSKEFQTNPDSSYTIGNTYYKDGKIKSTEEKKQNQLISKEYDKVGNLISLTKDKIEKISENEASHTPVEFVLYDTNKRIVLQQNVDEFGDWFSLEHNYIDSTLSSTHAFKSVNGKKSVHLWTNIFYNTGKLNCKLTYEDDKLVDYKLYDFSSNIIEQKTIGEFPVKVKWCNPDGAICCECDVIKGKLKNCGGIESNKRKRANKRKLTRY